MRWWCMRQDFSQIRDAFSWILAFALVGVVATALVAAFLLFQIVKALFGA